MEITSYGILLFSIIFDRIPTELKLLISRKFKNNVFDLDILIEIFKEELLARERVQVLTVIKTAALMKLITLQDIICRIIQINLIKNMKKIGFSFKSLCLLRREKSYID